VDISVREHRIRNGIVIAIVGLIAIFLTSWAGYDSFKSQNELNGQLTAIKKQLSPATVGLGFLGLIPASQELAPNRDFGIVMQFTVLEGTAKNMRCHWRAFSLPGPYSPEQNRAAIAKFKQEIADEQIFGEDRLRGSTCFKAFALKFDESQIAELTAAQPNRIIYVMGHVEWNNDAGADFHTDAYKWAELPKGRVIENPGWHDLIN
jgi:hypothetical protein